MCRLSFEEFKVLCEVNLDKKHIVECVDIIKNSDCLFWSGIAMPNEHITSLYKTRLKIAKGNKKLCEDYIKDFEDMVSNLNASSSNDLALTAIYSEDISFIIFYEPDKKAVLGVLKSSNSNDLQTIEGDAYPTVNKGHSPGLQKYSKGKLVKEWD